jgi:hypothetical protein
MAVLLLLISDRLQNLVGGLAKRFCVSHSESSFPQHTSNNHTSQVRVNVLSSVRRFLLLVQKH